MAPGAVSVRVWEIASGGSRPGPGDRCRRVLMSTILLLRIMDIVEASGTSIAFPTSGDAARPGRRSRQGKGPSRDRGREELARSRGPALFQLLARADRGQNRLDYPPVDSAVTRHPSGARK